MLEIWVSERCSGGGNSSRVYTTAPFPLSSTHFNRNKLQQSIHIINAHSLNKWRCITKESRNHSAISIFSAELLIKSLQQVSHCLCPVKRDEKGNCSQGTSYLWPKQARNPWKSCLAKVALQITAKTNTRTRNNSKFTSNSWSLEDTPRAQQLQSKRNPLGFFRLDWWEISRKKTEEFQKYWARSNTRRPHRLLRSHRLSLFAPQMGGIPTPDLPDACLAWTPISRSRMENI